MMSGCFRALGNGPWRGGPGVHDRIEQAMNEAMCAEFGHEIVDDQCNIPEHRYCVWCMKREPTLREEAK